MSQRKIEIDNIVRFVCFANGLQSEHDSSKDSPEKTRQNKRSKNQKKINKNRTGEELEVIN